MLIVFPVGRWEEIPPEIRFSQAWYDSDFCDDTDLTPIQRYELTKFGYTLAYEAGLRGNSLRRIGRRIHQAA